MKEQKILYFDIINGISGDMTLATLLDLGVPKQIFLEELDKLNLGKEFKIEITDKFENGIKGTNVNVVVNEGHVHRNLIDIYDIIDKSTLNDKIKQNAKDIFMEVAKAEAKVHGTSIDKIHFHEVGAMDSIIDIVGSCILLDLLCVDEIYATKVPLGSGFVKCAHGVIPVPAPAVVEILKDVPVKFNNVKGECTTPTGAAIIKTVCDKFVDEVEFEIKQVGYGIGYKKFEFPNMLRTFIGVKKNRIQNIVWEISANIDDMSSETYSYLYEQILEKGALDIYTEGIFMKKNRPAYKITVLCKEKDLDKFTKLLLVETSTFGVRYQKLKRFMLERKFEKIETKYGNIQIKLGYLNGELIKVTPEYEDCKIIAKKENLPLIKVFNEINCIISEKFFFNY